MKAKLLKLALCAIAALPIGAWAEVTPLKKWDFANTAFTETELANIKADGETIYSKTTENTRYVYVPKLSSASSLKAQSTELDFTKGLKFQSGEGTSAFRIYSKNSLELQRPAAKLDGTALNNASYVIIPDLPKGASVEIRFKANSASDIKIVSADLADEVSPTTQTTIATYKGIVKASGDVAIACARDANIWCQIISISVYENTVTDVVSSHMAIADNADESLSASTTTGTWTKGTASFTITANNGDLVRNMEAGGYRIDTYLPISFNKGGSAENRGVYNISKSGPIKSIKIKAKAASDTEGVTLDADYGLDGHTQLSSNLPLRTATASEFDITNYTNIKVGGGVYAIFEIEYYDIQLYVANINWASLYLPVAVAIPSGVKAYYASAISSSSVTLTELTDNIPANTGVLINAESGTYNFTPASTEVAAISGNKFEGITADASTSTLDGTGIFVLSGATDDKSAPKFANYTGATLGAYKAYIPQSVNGISRITALDFIFEEATAVQNVVAAPQADNAGVKKYFKNGMLVIETANGTFNTAGMQVK